MLHNVEKNSPIKIYYYFLKKWKSIEFKNNNLLYVYNIIYMYEY